MNKPNRKTEKIEFYIEAQLRKRSEELAKDLNMTLEEFFVEAIKEYIKTHNKK